MSATPFFLPLALFGMERSCKHFPTILTDELKLIKHMKRRRARVPIRGQCVLLQISRRKKVFDFLDILLTPEKFVKILENRLQSIKNAQKLVKKKYVHKVEKSRLVFAFQ